MKMIKKYLYLIIIGAALFGFSQPVFAVLGETGLKNPLKISTFPELIGVISDIVLTIGGTAAVLFLIWSGFLFVTARGSEEQLKKARSTFTWTVIGTAVLLGAAVIAEIIVNFFAGL